MNTDINLLIKKDEKSLKVEKRVKTLNIFAAIFLVIVGIASVFVFLLIQFVDLQLIKSQQEDVLKKITLLKERQAKLSIANNRVENIEEIFKKRKDLPQASDSILSKVSSQVIVDNLEIDTASVLLIVSSTSLSSIGDLIESLADMVRRNDTFSSLIINSLVFEVDKNSYQLTVKADL